jgi:hypothetical protein
MSAIAVAALVLAAVWLVALTVVVMLLVRQVGLVTIRLDRAREQSSPVNDGLATGSDLPESAVGVLPEDAEPAYLLILAAGCHPCRELADSMHDMPLSRAVAIVSGRLDRAADLAGRLPRWLPATFDPQAATIVEELHVSTTPFVFEVRDGRIAAKAVVRGADHLASFLVRSQDLERRPASDHLEVTASARRV